MPIGTLGSSLCDGQVAAIVVGMPPSFATASRKRKRSANNDAEADESEAASGSGDEEPEDGEDLDAMAAEDDAEAQDEYDLDDGFIAKSDEESDEASDKDSDEPDDKGEEEEEEEDDFTYREPAPVAEVIIDVLKAKEDVTPLEAKNPVPEFDGKAQLYETGKLRLADGTVIEAKHTYVVKGKTGYTSTTTLIEQFFDKFDAPKVSLGMVKASDGSKITSTAAQPNHGQHTQIRESWGNGQCAGRSGQHAETMQRNGKALCRGHAWLGRRICHAGQSMA